MLMTPKDYVKVTILLCVLASLGGVLAGQIDAEMNFSKLSNDCLRLDEGQKKLIEASGQAHFYNICPEPLPNP
jgi:hypothetical protein